MDTTNHSINCREPAGLLGDHVNAFFDDLRQAGYAHGTIRKKFWVLSAFSRWLERNDIVFPHFDESTISSFLARLRNTAHDRIRFERSVMLLFLGYLRRHQIARSAPDRNEPFEADRLLERYGTYLTHDLGLAKNTVLVYIPYIRDYIQGQTLSAGRVAPQVFEATTLRQHLLTRSQGRSGEFVRLMAVALRSFCRFLFLAGLTPTNQADSLPSVRRWRQSTVPSPLPASQQQAILAATNRRTPTGCRDYAILLLLARLGLRAGEIVALTLDDIRWRSAELVIHGKGNVEERVPLLSDVGEALAAYLRNGRAVSSSRHVFLRTWAPHTGLTGPAAIGHIVRKAFARVGFRPPGRGAAHLFRHGLATTLIRQGASMAQIAQVMRHRSEDSTAIYAKVAFEDLRQVAKPWPMVGSA